LIYAYCLTPNHFHLLIETKRFPLSVIMQRLLTRYVKNFNFRHRRIGHLFQGRYVDDYRERVTEKTTAAAGEVKLIPLERLVTGSKAKMPLEMLPGEATMKSRGCPKRT